MRLNTLQPANNSRTKSFRCGRGKGTGIGKTCGRGHKGQKARGPSKIGFIGGQTPLHRALGKYGFNSRKALSRAEIKLSTLEKFAKTIGAQKIDFAVVKKMLDRKVKKVKIIAAAEKITTALTIEGLAISAGAKVMVEAAGGTVN